MVNGFRYKLYSTVSDSEQLKKEEEVIFFTMALFKLGRSMTLAEEMKLFVSISFDHKVIWISLGL